MLVRALRFPGWIIEGLVERTVRIVTRLASLSIGHDHPSGDQLGALVFLVLETHQVWFQIPGSGPVTCLALDTHQPRRFFEAFKTAWLPVAGNVARQTVGVMRIV